MMANVNERFHGLGSAAEARLPKGQIIDDVEEGALSGELLPPAPSRMTVAPREYVLEGSSESESDSDSESACTREKG